MSVTFSAGRYIEETPGHTVLFCGPDHSHRRPESCCEDASLYFGLCEHNDADEAACGCRADEVNVSNANAAALLELLGLRPDGEPVGTLPVLDLPDFGELMGQCPGEDFLGRVLTARAFLDARGDEGTPAHVLSGGPGTGSAMVVECGRAPGYFGDRLAQLENLATS